MKKYNSGFKEEVETIPAKSQNIVKALIIDDEPDICYLLSQILEQKNVQSFFAGSLFAADKIIDPEFPPDIIFLDNHLPDGPGIGYIHKLREMLPATKIAIITAHDFVAYREKASAQGADYFISKPFSREIILRTIEDIGGK